MQRMIRIAPVLVVSLCFGLPASAAPVSVKNVAELKSAIANAKAGDVITMAAGTYTIAQKVSVSKAGTATAPIVLRAAKLGDAKIRFNTAEGFKVGAPYWRFVNLDIQGVCAAHSSCEHAFHIVGRANNTIVRGCRLHDFNAMIKGNGEPIGSAGAYVWPNDVLIENTEFFNASVRKTANPVTPIDVVGGRRWIIRGNYIHDHAKGQGNTISYAAFLKGNSRGGLFDRNLVVCEKLHKGQVRLGLSFGGGGSSPAKICEGGTCDPEHQNGIMRNNIIVNCPADVGIYLNKAKNSKIFNNTIFNSSGVDVRFSSSSAELKNNILSGKIRSRESGAVNKGTSNLENVTLANWKAWFKNPAVADFGLKSGASFVDKGLTVAAVQWDFCNNDRNDGKNDKGAVEFDGDGPCNTTRPFVGAGPKPKPDAGAPVKDAGGPKPEAGVPPKGDAATSGDSGGIAADASAPISDGAIAGDGVAKTDDGGCGCRAGGGRSSAALLALGFLALIFIRRRA